MSNLPHPHLDLAGKIHPGLDILANEIVIALKKRTRFPANAPVYEAACGSPIRITAESRTTECRPAELKIGS